MEKLAAYPGAVPLDMIQAGDHGPPVVLIHGVGLRADTWGAQIETLAQDYRVYAFDTPGRGGSAPVGENPTLADYTDRFAEAIATLDEPALVAGHSMGALIVLDLGIRYPALVSGVAALNGVFRGRMQLRKAHKVGQQTLQPAKARTWGRPCHGGSAIPQLAPTNPRWRLAASGCWGQSIPAMPRPIPCLHTPDGPPTDDLAAMQCPALILTGEHETGSTPAMSREMARIAPNAGMLYYGRCEPHAAYDPSRRNQPRAAGLFCKVYRMNQPANLIVFLTDNHAAALMGAAGHPIIKTPNMDRISATGVRFTNAYCVSPLCCPSRAAIATGRYPHETGFWDNSLAYDGSVPTWQQRVRDQGHTAAAVGKLHYRSGDVDNGFSEEIVPLHIVDGKGAVIALLRATPEGMPQRKGHKEIYENSGIGQADYQLYDQQITDKAVEWLEAHAGDTGKTLGPVGILRQPTSTVSSAGAVLEPVSAGPSADAGAMAQSRPAAAPGDAISVLDEQL